MARSHAGDAVGLVANLGLGRPPNGQTAKARALLDLLERSGRRVDLADLGVGRLQLLKLVPMVRRGQTVVVSLNRRGLWVALALAAVTRRLSRRRSVVLVAVVGGWLPDYASSVGFRRLAAVADEFLAETPRLVRALADAGLPASELANFRRLPVDADRVRGDAGTPLRLCFASRVRADKGVVLAAELVDRLRAEDLPAVLDIFGPVEEEEALRRAVAHEGVTYQGVYGGAEALDVLSGYDFLVLPTSYEGECMPGVVVEAGFAALPAIVTDWGDLGHVVLDGRTGFVCRLDEFVEMAANRVRDCVRRGQLPELSRQALDGASSRFTETAALAVLTERIAVLEAGARLGEGRTVD